MVVVASEYTLSKDIAPIFQIFAPNSQGEFVHRPDLEVVKHAIGK